MVIAQDQEVLQVVSMTPDAYIICLGATTGYFTISVDGGQNWTDQTLIGSRNWRGTAVSAYGRYVMAASYLGGGGVYVAQINPGGSNNQLMIEAGSSVTICQM